jgi:ABC-2 type transport system permease protein
MILTLNDLAIACQNKTLYLILFIPLFVFVALQLVDGNEPEIQRLNIGLLEKGNYPLGMIQSLESAAPVFTVTWLVNQAQAKQWLKDKHGDGLLIPRGATGEDCTLIVLAEASLQTAAIVENVSTLQRVLEGKSKNWIAKIHPLQESGLQRQMLPTWILMLVLMVGFIVLPGQVAEEKEKKLLLGLLQTPIREVEWLLAKVSFGVILIVIAAILLHVLTMYTLNLASGLSYLAFLIAGGFCFTAFGILVGFLCRTQASARTLGVMFYLPLLLPSALADFSKPLHSVAPWVPSYQFYRPIKSILLDGGRLSDFPLDFFALLAVGLITSLLSYQLMKKRWLM